MKAAKECGISTELEIFQNFLTEAAKKNHPDHPEWCDRYLSRFQKMKETIKKDSELSQYFPLDSKSEK